MTTTPPPTGATTATWTLRACLVLCAAPLLGCEAIVGIHDLVPDDGSTGPCRPREPVDFAVAELGVLAETPLASLHVADLTGDGKLDLVWSDFTATGRFKRNVSVAGQPTAFATANETIPIWATEVANPFIDLNGDRKLDLIGNPESGGLLNTTPAGGTTPVFGMGYFIDLGGSTRGLRLALLNADNRLDMIGWSGADARIRRNTTAAGSTTIAFDALVSVAAAPTGYVVTDIQLAEINADGKPDLVVASEQPGTHLSMISVLPNTTGTGAATFAARVDFAQPLPGVLSLALGDVDGDGLVDLVVGGFGAANRIRLLRNTTAMRSNAVAFESVALDDNQFSVLRDLNGDGKPDLAYYSATSRVVTVRVNTTATAGMPQFSAPLTIGAELDRIRGVDDLNGDGKPDLIALALVGERTTAALWLSGSHCTAP